MGIGMGDGGGRWWWSQPGCVCVSLSRGSQEVNYRQILDVCVSQQRFTRSTLSPNFGCVCVSLSRGSQEVNYRQILDVCVSQQRFTRSKLWSIL